MSLLLDTHVWIWSQEDPDRLGPKTMARLAAADEALYVSAVSTLEIARLIHGGLLHLEGTIEQWIEDSLEALQCNTLDITHAMAIGAYRLPDAFHKDPADRLLVATAMEHRLTLVTADERILTHAPAPTLDARS